MEQLNNGVAVQRYRNVYALHPIVVRRARFQDWASICYLRDKFFLAHEEPIQERDNAYWVVAESTGRIVACFSYEERALERTRVIYDIYTDGTRVGLRGGSAIMEQICVEADEDGIHLIGLTRMANQGIIKAGLQRGWYEIGVLLGRKAKGVE